MKKEKGISSIANKVILESISDGVFTVDHEWLITSFNRAAEELPAFHGMRRLAATAGRSSARICARVIVH